MTMFSSELFLSYHQNTLILLFFKFFYGNSFNYLNMLICNSTGHVKGP